MAFKFGRNRSPYEVPKLRMSNYRAGALRTPPDEADYRSAAAKSLKRVYLNDQLGCCVISGGAHMRGVTSANAGSEVEFPDRDINRMYRIIGGGGDNGANLQTAMNYWLRQGFTDGVKLMGWLAVDAADPQEYKTACWLFENLYFGIECPSKWYNPMPSRSGFVWDAAGSPVPKNGHCVTGVGYNKDGVIISTWGMTGLLTDAAINKYCTRRGGGEIYVMISPDMIGEAQNKAPNGLNWHELITDFNLLGGNLPVPPDLEPQPIDWSQII
jgi:hypothetical protein